jgi:hypothetical protein
MVGILDSGFLQPAYTCFWPFALFYSQWVSSIEEVLHFAP